MSYTLFDGKEFAMKYAAQEIDYHVWMIADCINHWYEESQVPVVVIGVLKGCVHYLSDLTKHFNFSFELDFVEVQSYNGQTEQGELRLTKDAAIDVAGYRVIIVDDIVDTGKTAQLLVDHFKEKGAFEVIFSAACKKDHCALRGATIYPAIVLDYEDNNAFLLGYGMDINNKFRNETSIFELVKGK